MSCTNFEVSPPVKKLKISFKGIITEPKIRFSNTKIVNEISIKIYQPLYDGLMLNSINFEASKIVQKKINAFYFIFVILPPPGITLKNYL